MGCGSSHVGQPATPISLNGVQLNKGRRQPVEDVKKSENNISIEEYYEVE
jgi:hypothetical protein